MDHQVAFFNNANQIIFDLNNMINNQFINNYIKETYFDKFNDTKNIILNYENNINLINDENNENNKNNVYNFENYIIVVDVLTYNKLNITKYNSY